MLAITILVEKDSAGTVGDFYWATATGAIAYRASTQEAAVRGFRKSNSGFEKAVIKNAAN